MRESAATEPLRFAIDAGEPKSARAATPAMMNEETATLTEEDLELLEGEDEDTPQAPGLVLDWDDVDTAVWTPPSSLLRASTPPPR